MSQVRLSSHWYHQPREHRRWLLSAVRSIGQRYLAILDTSNDNPSPLILKELESWSVNLFLPHPCSHCPVTYDSIFASYRTRAVHVLRKKTSTRARARARALHGATPTLIFNNWPHQLWTECAGPAPSVLHLPTYSSPHSHLPSIPPLSSLSQTRRFLWAYKDVDKAINQTWPYIHIVLLYVDDRSLKSP